MNYPPSVYSHCCISIFLPAQALFLHSSFTLLLRCFELKCKTFVLGDHCQGMLVLMTVFCVLTINLPIITGKGAYINYIKTLIAHKKIIFDLTCMLILIQSSCTRSGIRSAFSLLMLQSTSSFFFHTVVVR